MEWCVQWLREGTRDPEDVGFQGKVWKVGRMELGRCGEQMAEERRRIWGAGEELEQAQLRG